MSDDLVGTAGPRLNIVVPVWGDAYLDTFLEYSLPAQLAAGNVPALEGSGHCYTIYTTAEGRRRCEEHVAVRQLTRFVAVTFKSLEVVATYNAGNKYRTKSDCYAIELEAASRSGAAVAMLNADILLADGFIREALRLLRSGKRVIEVTGGRGLQDPIKTALDSEFRQYNRIISISPSELSRLWLANLHPQLAMHYVDGPEGGSFHPSHLYWLAGEEGVIIRAFHLYPIVVKPNASPVKFSGTIDDDLVALLAAAPDERLIAQNSSDLFCCELSPPEHFVGDVAWRGNRKSIIDFYLGYRTENIENLEKEIIISSKPPVGELWDRTRRDSSDFIDTLISDLKSELLRRCVAREADDLMAKAAAEIEDDGDFIKAIGQMLENGHPIPLALEERSLRIHLKTYPDRADLLQRLCAVLGAQGKVVPLELEERALKAIIELHPDRRDLLERLRLVQVGLGRQLRQPP